MISCYIGWVNFIMRIARLGAVRVRKFILSEQRVNVKRKVYKVEIPEYLSVEEISKKFWDNFVLVTNTTGSNAGIVRYYCHSNEPELTKLIMEMDKEEETYGDCLIYYVGQGRGLLGVYM